MSDSQNNPEQGQGEQQPLVPYVFDDGDEFSLQFIPPGQAAANKAADTEIAQQYNGLLAAILAGDVPSLLLQGRRQQPPESEEPPTA